MSQEGELSRLGSLLLRAKLLPGEGEPGQLWGAGGAQGRGCAEVPAPTHL